MELWFIFLQLSTTWVSLSTRISLFRSMFPTPHKSAIFNCVDSNSIHNFGMKTDKNKTCFWAYLFSAGTQQGKLHPAGWPILFCSWVNFHGLSTVFHPKNSLDNSPQWGAADAEIKVPSGENTELKRSPFHAWSRSVYSHTCYTYCQGFLFSCLFLHFRSIHLHFFQNLSRFFPVLACRIK